MKSRLPMGSAPPGNRQRQRTRAALLNAGQRLFASRPVEGVSIDDIAAAADVAKGSFYNHFRDKDELAQVIYDLVNGDCEFHIYSANQHVADPPTRIARALCVVIRYTQDHDDRFGALLNLANRKTAIDAPLNAGAKDDVEQGLVSGRLRGVTLETGLLVVLGLIRVAAQHALAPETKTPVNILAREMGAAMLCALGVEHDEAARLAEAASTELLGEGASHERR